MKIALAQISMCDDLQKNLEKSLEYCDRAKDSDLLFFPEIQLSPFFPQYEKKNVDKYCLNLNSNEIKCLAKKAEEHKYYFSPNVYLEQGDNRYDASLWIIPEGQVEDVIYILGEVSSLININRKLTKSKMEENQIV